MKSDPLRVRNRSLKDSHAARLASHDACRMRLSLRSANLLFIVGCANFEDWYFIAKTHQQLALVVMLLLFQNIFRFLLHNTFRNNLR